MSGDELPGTVRTHGRTGARSARPVSPGSGCRKRDRSGRTVGTYQADAVGPHTHPLSLWRHSADGGGIYAYAKWDGFDNSIWTRENTGSETRPKNMAVRYLVRARP